MEILFYFGSGSSLWEGNFIPTNLDLFYNWCTTVMLSTVLSVILIILIETPFVNIELTYLRKSHVKRIQNIEEPLFGTTTIQ